MRKLVLPVMVVLAFLCCESAQGQKRKWFKKNTPQHVSGYVVIISGDPGGGGGGVACDAVGGTVTITSSSDGRCAGNNSTTLTVTGNVGAIQWLSSTDNSNFNLIDGANASSYTAVNLTTTTYFAVQATQNGCTKYSNSVAVTISNGSLWYKDADNDGYSDGTTLTQCDQPAGYKSASELKATTGDCNDNNASLNPETLWYKDHDKDGYSDGTTVASCTRPVIPIDPNNPFSEIENYVLRSQLHGPLLEFDCDDNNPAVFPGAAGSNCYHCPSGSIIYVNQNVVGGANDGSSWANAYTSLQTALFQACPNVTQIWVARGVYYPDDGGESSNNDRKAAFVLRNNLAIYGGFVGTETALNQRDWKLNETYLSGDIDQNDVDANREGNSYHVVYNNNNNLDNTAILDGFIIASGNANYAGTDPSIPTIGGGGIVNISSSPSIVHCTIEGNSTIYNGGAIYIESASPLFANCKIDQNTASLNGGGAYMKSNAASGPISFQNCTIEDNDGTAGAGMFDEAARVEVINSSFIENGSSGVGGFVNEAGAATIINSIFSRNRIGVINAPGGVINAAQAGHGHVIAVNCSFSQNQTSISNNGNLEVYNSISDLSITDNTPAGTSHTFTVMYSDAPGLPAGNNNLSTDPLFVDPAHDNLSLQPGSPVIDKGSDQLYDQFSSETSDLAGNPRKSGTIDMGAYEYTVCTPSNWVLDKDNDGYYTGNPVSSCTSPGTGYHQQTTQLPGDCDDNNAAINPGTVWVIDGDGDTYFSDAVITGCTAPAGYVIKTSQQLGDCDDANPLINPATIWYADRDQDGYTAGEYLAQCSRPKFYSHNDPSLFTWGKMASELTSMDLDCDDDNYFIRPTTWYKDLDGDGYSDGSTLFQCLQPQGYKLSKNLIATSGDCDDNDPLVNPGAAEIAADGVDNNCNGIVDEITCSPISLTSTVIAPLTIPGCSVTDIGEVTFAYSTTAVNLSAAQYAAIGFSVAENSCALASVSYSDAVQSSASGTVVVLRTFTLTDVNGKTATASQTITVQDNIKPTANAKNQTIYLDASGMASITAADVNNNSSDNCTEPAALQLSLDKSSFDCTNLGDNTVTLTVTDIAGNSSTATATVTIIDNSQPTVITKNITVELDGTGHASITPAQVNNGSTDNCTSAASLQLSLDKTDFDCSNRGDNTVTLTVQDASGNSQTGTAIITVQDKRAPTVVTKNITVQPDENGFATISDNAVDNGSYDNCTVSANLIFSTNIKSFNCSNTVTPVTVSLTVTDASGNSSTSTATVTVQDKMAPVVKTKNITVYLSEAGTASITATDVNGGSTDNCSVISYSLDKSSFDCSNTGANTVRLTVTDLSGNSATGTATVTVVDNIAPTVKTKSATIYLDATGKASLTAAQVNNGSFDNCSLELTLDKSSFDCSNLGINTVTLTGKDGSMNTESVAATVTVVDDMAPVVKTKPLTVYLGTDGQVVISAADVNDGSSDNCSIASMSLDRTTFTSADLSSCQNVFTVNLTVTDGSGNTASSSASVTVKKRITQLVYGGATSGAYSDPANVSATLYDVTGGTLLPLANKTVSFTLGNQSAADTYGGSGGGTDGNGLATAILVLNQAPGTSYNVMSAFAGDALYCASSNSTGFAINPEDICAQYNGQLSVAATVLNKTSNSAKVVMSVGLEEVADGYPGDVTKAIVEFNYNGSWIPVPVQALNTEKTEGNASLIATINFSGDASTLSFAYRVSGYYQVDDACSDNGQSIINVYKPQGEFITGGGTIVPLASAGSLPSDAGRKSNFGFNVKYNQKGTNLQGNISYLFRRKEADGVVHVYQVKGNSMTSLTVNLKDAAEGGARTAVFSGKCNITDVTNPLFPVSVPGTGNSIMQVIITDGGDLTTSDKYGIAVWTSNNQLLYSSNWQSTKTTKLALSGGNVVVSGTTTTATATAPVFRNGFERSDRILDVPLEVVVLGNPSNTTFSLTVKSGTQERIRMRIVDANGRTIETREALMVGQTITIGNAFAQGTYFAEFLQGNQRKVVKLVKL